MSLGLWNVGLGRNNTLDLFALDISDCSLTLCQHCLETKQGSTIETLKGASTLLTSLALHKIWMTTVLVQQAAAVIADQFCLFIPRID